MGAEQREGAGGEMNPNGHNTRTVENLNLRYALEDARKIIEHLLGHITDLGQIPVSTRKRIEKVLKETK
jgi:hypothetical protein